MGPHPVFDEADVAGLTRHFADHGWVHVRPGPGDIRRVALRDWAEEIGGWPDDGGDWLHFRELTDHGPALCRTENIVPHHPGVRALLCTGPMLAVAGAILGEPAVLYKDKLNHKLPGGAGYAPHQDAPAYRFVETHVSCMVAIDDATTSNGCLEVVSGAHHRLWPTDDDGCIQAQVAEAMVWDPAEVPAGETLWFHSRTPHRSGPNTSDRPRRALYPTYNALAEGDLRAAYYRQKAAELRQAAAGDRIPVSLIGDFQGRPVR